MQKVILEEEISFLRTLDKGLNIINDYTDYLLKVNDYLDKQYELSKSNSHFGT